MQDVQKGCPARPQRAKRRMVLCTGEPLSNARTPLAVFFRILLERRFGKRIRTRGRVASSAHGIEPHLVIARVRLLYDGVHAHCGCPPKTGSGSKCHQAGRTRLPEVMFFSAEVKGSTA